MQRGILATLADRSALRRFQIDIRIGRETASARAIPSWRRRFTINSRSRGRRVFFARITLEDKAGQQYEPYIFAALNSTKVMIVVGTSARNFNAVWVKNEWSRFLALMKKDKKKLLLPCYRDMDPYDLRTALRIAGLRYEQDRLFAGPHPRRQQGAGTRTRSRSRPMKRWSCRAEGASNLVALLKRGEMSLEDGEWKAANEFFDRALDMDAECAEAWRGKFLARVGAQSLTQQWGKRASNTCNAGKRASPRGRQCPTQRAPRPPQRASPCPGYLLEENIRVLYPLPEPYQAVLGYWQEKLEELRQSLDADRDLRRAAALPAARSRKARAEDRACADALAAALQSARQRDAEAEKAAREAYAQALNEADRKSEALCKEAEANREAYYQELCRKQAEGEKQRDVP